MSWIAQPPYAYAWASFSCSGAASGKRFKMVGLMASSHAESTMASWVSTEYAAAGCAAGSRTRSAKIEVAALLKPLRPLPIKRFKHDARRRFPDIARKDGLAVSLYPQYPESLRGDSLGGEPPADRRFSCKCCVRGMAIPIARVVRLRSTRPTLGPGKASHDPDAQAANRYLGSGSGTRRDSRGSLRRSSRLPSENPRDSARQDRA